MTTVGDEKLRVENPLSNLGKELPKNKKGINPKDLAIRVFDELNLTAEELDKLGGVRGCAFCGGLGHRITDCPKRDKNARQLGAGQRDMLLGGGGYGGEY